MTTPFLYLDAGVKFTAYSFDGDRETAEVLREACKLAELDFNVLEDAARPPARVDELVRTMPSELGAWFQVGWLTVFVANLAATCGQPELVERALEGYRASLLDVAISPSDSRALLKHFARMRSANGLSELNGLLEELRYRAKTSGQARTFVHHGDVVSGSKVSITGSTVGAFAVGSGAVANGSVSTVVAPNEPVGEVAEHRLGTASALPPARGTQEAAVHHAHVSLKFGEFELKGSFARWTIPILVLLALGALAYSAFGSDGFWQLVGREPASRSDAGVPLAALPTPRTQPREDHPRTTSTPATSPPRACVPDNSAVRRDAGTSGVGSDEGCVQTLSPDRIPSVAPLGAELTVYEPVHEDRIYWGVRYSTERYFDCVCRRQR